MARLLQILLLLTACGPAGHVTPEPAPRSTPHTDSSPHDSVIEGSVLDDESRAGLEGATVVAKPSASGQQEAVSITDSSGHFRMEVANGHYHLTAYYSDAQSYGDVDATVGNVAPVELVIAHADVEAAARLAEQPACPPVSNAPTPSVAETDALVGAVLERYLTDRDALPDGGMLPSTGPVFVVSDADGALRTTHSAIPKAGAGKLVFRTSRDLQADADRLGTEVFYVGFYRATISGDCATIGVGVYFAAPKNSKKIYLCCCSSTDVYERQHGRWVFKKRTEKICA
jgi:hypothetical protein